MEDARQRLSRGLRKRARHREFPSRETIASSADAQASFLFFRLLLELRQQIHEELWRQSGLARHISSVYAGYVGSRCVVDHEAPDDRQQDFWGDTSDPQWVRRLQSAWYNHWRCEEWLAAEISKEATHGQNHNDTRRSAFLPMLLSCRRM